MVKPKMKNCKLEFSVIVPTYNRIQSLIRCLNSLQNQSTRKNYEVIVIDDGSTDDTKHKLQNNPYVRYFQVNTNKGPASARNLGIKKSKGKIIVFTDDDCIVPNDWLENIDNKFSYYDVDAIGGAIIDPTNKYIAIVSHLLQFSKWIPVGSDRIIDNIPTANIAYKKNKINDLSFREENATYEDSLFNFDFVNKGNRILFVPSIIVTHMSWKNSYSLRKFFSIQRHTAIGFIKNGFKVHKSYGELFYKYTIFNLLCPNFVFIVFRMYKLKRLFKIIKYLPLLLVGDFYRGLCIVAFKNKFKKIN